MKQLKKCPFCGGENICETIFNWNYAISCRDCGAVMTAPMDFRGYRQEELEKRWNTRKSMERIVERLEKLKEYEMNGDCPRDGMCDKKPYECTSCYSKTAIEIVKEEM